MAVSRTSARRWPVATRNNPDFFIGNRARLHFRRFRQAREAVLRRTMSRYALLFARENSTPDDRWHPAYAIVPLGQAADAVAPRCR